MAQHASAIAESKGQRHVPHAGCGNPRDLGRDVGGESDQATGLTVIEAKGFFPQVGPQPELEDRQVLKDGGSNRTKAPGTVDAVQGVLQVVKLGRFDGQKIFHTGWQACFYDVRHNRVFL